MAEQLTTSIQVQIVNGPTLVASQSLQVSAYDKIAAAIPGVDKDDPGRPVTDPASSALPAIDVEVQPASSPEQVSVLSITSSRYSADLVYSVTGGAEGVALDSAQVFLGAGSIGLLGTSPQVLSFRNGMGVSNDASITILVGRRATTT